MPVGRLISRWIAGAAFVASIAALVACDETSEDDADGITVGLLLPFTGANSATSSNFERAVLFAASRVNQGGGIGGRHLRILSQDTHSDLSRARHSLSELIDAGAVAVIGPEGADIAVEIAPTLAASGVAFISPLVGAADDSAVSCAVPWFRLAPSALSLGDALAKRLAAEGVGKVAILYEARGYDQALRSAAKRRFETLGGSVSLELELDPNVQNYDASISAALAANVDAVLLTTSPRTAALVVNDYQAVSQRLPRWFLSPLLKTELLLENVAPSALEDAIGVAPKIFDESEDFPNAFAKRWEGDLPLEGAYFYYDATSLLALSLQKTVLANAGVVDLKTLNTEMLRTAATRGESVNWNDLEAGLARVAEGSEINYSGLTGPLLFGSCGVRSIGNSRGWTVHDSQIVNLPE